MKKILLNIVSLIKKVGFVSRLVVFAGALIMLFSFAIPELSFNIQMSNPKEFTIEELQKAPKSSLPRYIVVKDAKPMQASTPILLDSSSSESLKYMSYNYVIQSRVKKGDTTLSYILYPVYPKALIDQNPDADASKITSYVIMKDANVTKQDLDGDKYFKDASFAINGKYAGDAIDEESHKLLTESGYNVDKEAIILVKGEKPSSMGASIAYCLFTILIAFLFGLSLVPDGVLFKMFGGASEKNN